MSTVDLTKVAGFKAVDAEGNDMGVVSLSEMTNMVKESIIQEAVAMQSVSTLAEASTLAATDTYEDKLDISDTFSYVRTLDSSGNPKRTSQNALATVVGGLLPAASVSKNGLMTSGIYKLSALHFVNQNKKMKLFKLTSYAEAIFEIIGRSLYEEFVHLIVTHGNKNITIKKGIYNTSPDERISYKFYKDDTYLYVISNLDSFTVRTLGTTDINMLAFETNDDLSTSGLTPVSITG